MSEEQLGCIFRAVVHQLWTDLVPGVVHHAHGIPAWPFRLRVLEHVPTPHDDAAAVQEVRNLNVDVPVQPRPELVAMAYWRVGKTADAVEPGGATIERYLHALDFVTAAVVGVAGNAVRLARPRVSGRDPLSLGGFDDDRVEILLVTCAARVSEHGACELAVLFRDEAW